MSYSQEVLDFWERAKKATGIEGDFTDAWGFGDNPELVDELLGYIKQGIKRSSTALEVENMLEGWPNPVEGGYDISLDGSEKPVLVIKTTSVRYVKYRDVDAEHAYWEGEGDRSLESYFHEHDKYYKRRGEALGFSFNKDMMVYLSRFEVVYSE